MEDQAIGGGSGASMGPSAAEKADNSGPLEKRIVSKNWSVRAGAYDELTKMCTDSAKKSKADFFKDHVGSWKDYLKDSNPGALEKALVCLQAFVDKIHKDLLPENQNAIISMLVEKCIGHAKPVIKDKAMECIMLIFEVSENFEDSVETLQGLAAHKNVKVMTCGTLVVAELLKSFGIKKVRIPDYGEQMLKNAQNANPACKNAAYEYYKAAYKWIGDALLPQITDKLKKAQIDELQKSFDELKAKADKTQRHTRSEQAKAAEAALNAQIDAAMEEEKKNEEIDPLEFAPEKDVISQFGPEWQDATAAIKKWDEKVAKLQEIIKACTNVKIKNANTDGLAAFLKKECSNTNVNIASAAIDAATAIATGMGKNFKESAKALVTPIFLKFKEKKINVQTAVPKFGEAILKCTNLEELLDEVKPLITNIAPGVKTGVLKFIEQAVQVTYIDVLKKIADEYLQAVAKTMEDKDGGVRDQALHCMGIFKGRIPEIAEKYLKDQNAQKMAKIDEAAKEIKPTKYDRPENWKPPAPKKAPAAKPKKAAAVVVDDDDGGGGDDELMTFDVKPKRAPPKGIGVKPPSRKKKEAENADMEESKGDVSMMSDAPPKTPAKKPPALSSDKPKTAAVKTSSKGPAAPQIQEEDTGTGLSKEEAIEKAQEFFSAGTIAKFEDAKWQVKKEGFDDIQREIQEKEANTEAIEAATKFIKAKMKDWKESNINLQKAIVAYFDFLSQNCENINKRTIQCAASWLIDKIGDVKLSQSIKDMLMNVSEIVTPKFICNQVIKYAATAKAPKTIQESCALITQIADEFGIGGIPLKESIDFGKIAAGHATPTVRQAALKLYAELYKHVGEAMRAFLTDIKESTLKLIDGELKNINPYSKGEHQKKRSFRGEAAAQESSAGGKGGKKKVDDDPLAMLPREDISKKLNAKLMEQFKNKDWKIRKKAGDDVEALLREAKMRIENNGLNDLMDAMKQGMKDPNKAVVKVYINLLGLLADAIGSSISQFTKKCFVPMLNNITDKQSLVRADVISAMNKWKEAMGAEKVINQLGPMLELENPEGRTECLKWISENKDGLMDADGGSLVKPLVLCLTDKSKAIREASESIILEVMPKTGYQSFVNATNDMKPAVKQTLKPILEKLKSKAGDAGPPAAEKKEEEKSQGKKPEAKAAAPNSFAKAAKEKKEEEKEKKVVATPSKATPARKAAAEEDEYSILKTLSKQKRQQHDQKVKWPLLEVKGDHIEKLQNYCFDIFGEQLHNLMWAKAQDFQKHIKCVDIISKFMDTQPDEFCQILDIILKWTNVRLNESINTKLMISILDMYGQMMKFLVSQANPLEDFEAHVLLGTLCDKVGINNKILMDKIRSLIKMTYDVYDIALIYRLIVDIGCKVKNQKSIAECLDEVACFIQTNGIDTVTKKDFALFLQHAESSDKGLRENSLKVFAEAYLLLQEDVWRLLPKDIPTKVKGLLEQRFIQVSKKASNALALSTNSQNLGGVRNPLLMSGKGPVKRMSVMPGVGGMGLGGLKLKAKAMEMEQRADSPMSSNHSQGDHLTQDMKKFAPFNDRETDETPIRGAKPREDVEMKDEEQKAEDLKDVFKGKSLPNDVEEQKLPAPKEDDVAMVIDHKNKPIEATINKAESVLQPQQNPPEEMNAQQKEDEIQAMLKKAEMNLDIDPELRKEQKNILNHIQQLVEGDLLKRVDSLVALNELISNSGPQNSDGAVESEQTLQQQALIRCCNELISSFIHVMNDIFSYPVQDIPLRFTKYFITIVNKTCACKEIMREVNEKQVSQLTEQLLTRLLIENLDKVGSNKEGELILKNLNSAMLRSLENCNHTYIFVVLFDMLVRYKDNPDFPKLPGLTIKCLLKLSKIMDKIIEKIDLSRFLLSIHKYLCSVNIGNSQPKSNERANNDELGVRIVKTLVNEVVKIKREEIWICYEIVEKDAEADNHIKKWIQIILKSLPTSSIPQPVKQASTTSETMNQSSGKKDQPQSRMYIEFEIKKIIADLKDFSKLESAIQRLDKFSKTNPNYDFKPNLMKESEAFCKKTLQQLENFRNGSSLKSTNEDSLGDNTGRLSAVDKMAAFKSKLNAVHKKPSTTDLNRSIDKQSEFKNKMAALKNKQSLNNSSIGMGLGQQTERNTIQVGAAGNLNTTFSAMNSSLSQKWAAINAGQKKAGALSGRPGTAQTNLASTINPQSQNLNESANKFKSKLGQGNFQNKLTSNSKIPPTGHSGIAKPSGTGELNKSGNMMNSFKSRLQGLQANATSGQAQSANSQDLQKRLAEMKARLQGIKK